MNLSSSSFPVPGRSSGTPEKEHKLTELQQTIVELIVSSEDLEQKEIAKRLDCNRVTVSKSLQLQHVKEAIIQQVNSQLLRSAPIALATQHKLLSSKSDYIKHQAAKDLLDRNAIGESTTVLGQAISVKIDLS